MVFLGMIAIVTISSFTITIIAKKTGEESKRYSNKSKDEDIGCNDFLVSFKNYTIDAKRSLNEEGELKIFKLIDILVNYLNL
jgi:hypothetical protein